MEEGRKTFEDYLTDLRELFLLRCEVTRQGTVLRDTTLIVFNKPEVIPEVRPDPSPSRNDIQAMINSALERQAKSVNELLRRLIKEQDEKKIDATSVNLSSSTCTVSFTQTNPRTSGPSVGGTFMPNPLAQPVNHFHSWTTIEKPEESSQHLKPLYIQGHSDGKPISRMLVNGGAIVNLMSYSISKKLGRKNDELMKTNLTLNDVGGIPMEVRGVISMELTEQVARYRILHHRGAR
jgi:hypothetical protein